MSTLLDQLELCIKFIGAKTGTFDYNQQKAKYLLTRGREITQAIRNEVLAIGSTDETHRKKNDEILHLVSSLHECFDSGPKEKALTLLAELRKLYDSRTTKITSKHPLRKIEIPALPPNLREELITDIKETYACLDSGCYRASTILCGRILETSLFYVYFKKTGNDLLVTAPMLGLGKLIAKLSENNISVSPGLNEQVHLINKVRIQSVHKKQEFFYPSREQAEAMILYTLDILNKCFS